MAALATSWRRSPIRCSVAASLASAEPSPVSADCRARLADSVWLLWTATPASRARTADSSSSSLALRVSTWVASSAFFSRAASRCSSGDGAADQAGGAKATTSNRTSAAASFLVFVMVGAEGAADPKVAKT